MRDEQRQQRDRTDDRRGDQYGTDHERLERRTRQRNATLQQALRCGKRGWHIFPVWHLRDDGSCGCRNADCGRNAGKHPIPDCAPHGFKDATTDAKAIKAWWSKYPDAGIALATGAKSGIIVIDVDTKHGHKGPQTLLLLMQELDSVLPDTRIAYTMSAAMSHHRYFRYAEGIASGVLGDGVDIKSDGGYVVMPPSHGKYKWKVNGDGKTTPVAKLPDAWVMHLRALKQGGTTGTSSSNGPADLRDVAMALEIIPNHDLDWKGWNRIAMATWRATDGSEEGFAAFDRWSQKWHGYNADDTRKRWQSISRSPPHTIGPGTLFYLADQVRPGWRKTGESKQHENIHSWEAPDLSLLDDQRGELPEFPVEVFDSERMRKWITDQAHATGTTTGHVAVPFLGIVSGLIGCSRFIAPVKSWREPMTCWTATIAYSGSGKTPGLDATHKALDEVEREREDEITELRREHAEQTARAAAAKEQWTKDIKEAVKNGEPTPPKPPDAEEVGEFIAPRLSTNDVTIERLAMLLQARPQGIVLIRSELSGFYGNMARYTGAGGRDNEFYLECWDGRPYDFERVKRSRVHVDHLSVSLVGGMQPDKVAEAFKGAADGMYARFCFTWPADPPYRELTDTIEEIDPDIVDLLSRLSSLPRRLPNVMPLSDKARKVFEGVRREVRRHAVALQGREREWMAKVPAHVLRVAGTLALIDATINRDGDVFRIIDRDIKNASRLVFDYFWPHSRAVLRLIGRDQHDSDLRRMLRWVAVTKTDPVSLHDLRRKALSQAKTEKQTYALIQQLEQAGWLRLVERPEKSKPGRPAHRWQVNPLLFELLRIV